MIKVDVLYSVMGVATQALLSHESGDLLVDAGDGVTRDLIERRYDFYRLRGNLGYSIMDGEGFRVVLSGDTRPCKELEREADGADIAVVEASARDQDMQKAIEQGHMTKSEAERIGRRAKRAVYIHQRPEWFV